MVVLALVVAVVAATVAVVLAVAVAAEEEVEVYDPGTSYCRTHSVVKF